MVDGAGDPGEVFAGGEMLAGDGAVAELVLEHAEGANVKTASSTIDTRRRPAIPAITAATRAVWRVCRSMAACLGRCFITCGLSADRDVRASVRSLRHGRIEEIMYVRGRARTATRSRVIRAARVPVFTQIRTSTALRTAVDAISAKALVNHSCRSHVNHATDLDYGLPSTGSDQSPRQVPTACTRTVIASSCGVQKQIAQ